MLQGYPYLFTGRAGLGRVIARVLTAQGLLQMEDLRSGLVAQWWRLPSMC